MKPKRMLLMLLLTLIGVMGANAQTYIVTVGDQVTTADAVEDNGLYALYNPRNGKCMYEDSSNKLLLNGGLSLDGLSGSTTTYSIFRLISNGDGTYKIQNYDTNRYLPAPTGNGGISTSETAGNYALNIQSDGNMFPRCTNNGTTYGLDHTSAEGVYAYTTLNMTNGSAQNYQLYKITLTEYVEPEGIAIVTLNNTNTSRGALIYNPSASEKWVWSSGKSGTFSSTDANSQWVFYPTGDAREYYLYNVGAQKFAVPTQDGNYSGYSWLFSHDAVAVTLNEQSDGTYKIFTVNGSICMSVSNGYTGPIINYNDVGAQFTMTKLAEISDAQTQEIESAVAKLVHNTTPLAATPTGDGWYTIRVKTHNTYPDYFLFTPDEEIVFNGTNYALNFYSAYKDRPAIDNPTYYFRIATDGSGYDWQMPNGRYLYNNNNKFPVSTETATAINVDYSSNGFRFYHNARFAVPYLLNSTYFVGETASTGNAYYDIYPIDLDEAGLVAWQVLCDNAAETTKISCTRSDVSGLTSVYRNGYFFLPSGVTPESSDFSMPGGLSYTVDATAHTVTIEYDPSLAIVAEGVSVYQGYGTTGLGNDKAVLLRIQAAPFNALENAVMNFSLTNADYITGVKVYETGNNVEFNAINSYTNTFDGTIADGTASVELGSVAVGTHYYWLCATVADNAVVGESIDAALTSITYDYNGYTGTSCDLTAVGNPNNSMKIFDVQKFLFLPTVDGDYCRIPALITADDGSIVAACDKRYGNSSDLGSHKIDVILRRSTDGGQTWSNVQTIAAGDGSTEAAYGYGDPSFVKGADGKLFCLFAAGSKGFGNGLKHIGMTTSTDNGATWSDVVDITTRSGQWTNNSGYEDFFVTSGKGLYTSDGVMMFLLDVDRSAEKNFVLYSTDEGNTWYVDANVVATGANEAKLVELEPGKLLSSTRAYYARIFNEGTYTKNADGTCTFTWGTQRTESALTQNGSGNNQDVVVYDRNTDNSAKILLHTITSGYGHKTLKLFMSIDQGSSWNEVMQVQPGGSRYAVTTVLSDGDLGILFEDYSLETGREYPINFLTITKEQIEEWYEELDEAVSSPDVKNSLQGSTVGCDSWGSFSNGSGWFSTWTSNDASGKAGVTVVAPGKDFAYATVYNQRVMAMRPSSNGATDEITITAPEGFYIDSYTIGGRNWSNSQSYKFISPDGTEVSTSAGAVNSLIVENVNSTTSTFKFYGSSTTNYLCITNFVIKLRSKYTVNLNTVGDASWATLYVPFDLAIPANTQAYYVEQVESNVAHLTEIIEDIPANTAVVLRNSEAATSVTFPLTKGVESVVDDDANLLKGTETAMPLDLGDDTPYYSLGRLNGTIGFYKFESNGSTTITLGANKAYLDTPMATVSTSAKGFRLVFGKDETIVSEDGGLVDGIDEVETVGKDVIYNLNGTRVNTLRKGIYIVNGKKVVVANH
ncbi:MAG: exo-alpha-sialidase [Prevotella sp.]|nr:exo-alpha-sialidase [Prevotella sp.]